MRVPLSELEVDRGLLWSGAAGETPEVAFDRQWARTVFARAQARLKEMCAGRERGGYLLEIQRRMFHPGPAGPDWREVAAAFGQTEGAVRKAAFDLRTQFAQVLRQEVAAVVGSDAEVDEELRHLYQLLSGAAS